MKQIDRNAIGIDEALLYTPGRGRNTWTIHFTGMTEEGESISFSYRLNISSIPVGFRYMKMFDTLLTVTYKDAVYVFDRDFGEIKRKQLKYDALFFASTYSKLQGSWSMIEVTAYGKDGAIDVAMDFAGCEEPEINFLNDLTFREIKEEAIYHVSAPRMDCQGIVTVKGKDYNVKGNAWVEKEYVAFPKGRLKKKSMKNIKVNFVPDDMAECFSVWYIADLHSGAEEYKAAFYDKSGYFKTYSNDEMLVTLEKPWHSQETGNDYPIFLKLNVAERDIEVKVYPSLEEQEAYISNKKTGEYLGTGFWHGSYGEESVQGTCVIAISGDF